VAIPKNTTWSTWAQETDARNQPSKQPQPQLRPAYQISPNSHDIQPKSNSNQTPHVLTNHVQVLDLSLNSNHTLRYCRQHTCQSNSQSNSRDSHVLYNPLAFPFLLCSCFSLWKTLLVASLTTVKVLVFLFCM